MPTSSFGSETVRYAFDASRRLPPGSFCDMLPDESTISTVETKTDAGAADEPAGAATAPAAAISRNAIERRFTANANLIIDPRPMTTSVRPPPRPAETCPRGHVRHHDGIPFTPRR